MLSIIKRAAELAANVNETLEIILLQKKLLNKLEKISPNTKFTKPFIDGLVNGAGGPKKLLRNTVNNVLTENELDEAKISSLSYQIMLATRLLKGIINYESGNPGNNVFVKYPIEDSKVIFDASKAKKLSDKEIISIQKMVKAADFKSVIDLDTVLKTLKPLNNFTLSAWEKRLTQ